MLTTFLAVLGVHGIQPSINSALRRLDKLGPMATQSAKGARLVLCSVLLFLLGAPALRTTDAMTVVLVNNMNQEVSITCTYGGSWPGPDDSRVVAPSGTYDIVIAGSGGDFTGVKYTFGFQTAGLQRAIVQVFLGTGGSGNEPCHCVGNECRWTITNIGFACPDYRHGWN